MLNNLQDNEDYELDKLNEEFASINFSLLQPRELDMYQEKIMELLYMENSLLATKVSMAFKK